MQVVRTNKHDFCTAKLGSCAADNESLLDTSGIYEMTAQREIERERERERERDSPWGVCKAHNAAGNHAAKPAGT